MVDWDKLKVTELKEELKSRGIPLTGLKLKQQLIDKLVEVESATLSENAVAGEVTNGALEEVAKGQDEQPKEEDSEMTEAAQEDISKKDASASDNETGPGESVSHSNRPPALKEEDSRAEETEMKDDPMSTEDVPMASNAEEVKEIQKNDVLIPQPEQLKVEDTSVTTIDDALQADKNADHSKPSEDHAREELEAKLAEPEQPTPIIDLNNKDSNSVVDEETREEQRKRKRRSATPVPLADEIQKKAKGSSGEAIVTKRASTPEKRSRSPIQSPKPDPAIRAQSSNLQQKENATSMRKSHSVEDHSRELEDNAGVEPALHTATRSLYLRNFKRPLHIPTLRAHISTVAQAHASGTEEDLVKFFYLDATRTHAFVTFSNIAAASRVRNAMHDTRFPDEPVREPLWIDFVPDDKVQDWVDQESSGSSSAGGGRLGGAGKGKFEVSYQKGNDGTMQASLREIGSNVSLQHRPNFSDAADRFGLSRSYSHEQNRAYAADPSRVATAASGIHPDRAGFVSRSSNLERRAPPRSPPLRYDEEREPKRQAREEDKTPAFNALSSLFSSTKAKPLLYFKLPAQSIIDARLDMIRDLHLDRGVSGEPGMKRYTLERIRGQEEWVDNGPEFGHGRKGMDRLAGESRGGYRGGRGGRGGRGRFGMGDSYRGGGAR